MSQIDLLFRPCPSVFRENFNRREIQHKGLTKYNGDNYEDPSGLFWLLRLADNDFEDESFFKVVDGKLLAHDIGTNGYPDNAVAYKSKSIPVDGGQKVQISFDLFKWSMFLA